MRSLTFIATQSIPMVSKRPVCSATITFEPTESVARAIAEGAAVRPGGARQGHHRGVVGAEGDGERVTPRVDRPEHADDGGDALIGLARVHPGGCVRVAHGADCPISSRSMGRQADAQATVGWHTRPASEPTPECRSCRAPAMTPDPGQDRGAQSDPVEPEGSQRAVTARHGRRPRWQASVEPNAASAPARNGTAAPAGRPPPHEGARDFSRGGAAPMTGSATCQDRTCWRRCAVNRRRRAAVRVAPLRETPGIERGRPGRPRATARRRSRPRMWERVLGRGVGPAEQARTAQDQSQRRSMPGVPRRSLDRSPRARKPSGGRAAAASR